MLETTGALATLEIRSSVGELYGDTAWLVEFAKFVASAYERALRFGDTLELRALTRAVARHLRSEDVPAELALAAIEAVLPGIAQSDDDVTVSMSQRVRDEAIRWSIIEYYASDSGRRVIPAAASRP
jgi:hypothetical protein